MLVVDIYIDNSFSDENFKRSEFNRIKQDIEDVKIDVILVKNHSFLGQKHLQAGYYMEIFFSNHDVRFIAVNNFMRFRNMINSSRRTYYHIIDITYFINSNLVTRSVYIFRQLHFQRTSPKIHAIFQSTADSSRLTVAQHQVSLISKVYGNSPAFSHYGNSLPVFVFGLRCLYHCTAVLYTSHHIRFDIFLD